MWNRPVLVHRAVFHVGNLHGRSRPRCSAGRKGREERRKEGLAYGDGHGPPFIASVAVVPCCSGCRECPGRRERSVVLRQAGGEAEGVSDHKRDDPALAAWIRVVVRLRRAGRPGLEPACDRTGYSVRRSLTLAAHQAVSPIFTWSVRGPSATRILKSTWPRFRTPSWSSSQSAD